MVEAEALEREIDHLDGLLYIDHVKSQDKLHQIERLTMLGDKIDSD
ncbi:peptide deformylase [Chloroflexota bacterium]